MTSQRKPGVLESTLVARLRDCERLVLEGASENRKLRELAMEMIERLRVEGVDPEPYVLEIKLLGRGVQVDEGFGEFSFRRYERERNMRVPRLDVDETGG